MLNTTRIRRIILVLPLFASLAASAHAKPEFLDLFKSHYKIADGSKLGLAGCLLCHTQPPKRNAYGKLLEAELDKTHAKALTIEMLVAVESLSAANDGVSNGDKIKSDRLPSVPDPNAPPKTTETKEQPAKDSPLIPTHSFHPTVVHFPIGLFLFGAFLDFLGAWKNKELWRQAGFINLVAGLISTAVVIPTGIIAMLRLGYGLEGTLLQHLVLASLATLLMAGVVAIRRKAPLNTPGYWITLGVAALGLAIAGHLGGTLVFG